MVAILVYALCGVTSLICVILLWRSYLRNRNNLTYWCAWCFGGLAVNNLLLIPDYVIFPDINFITFRTCVLLAGLVVLLYGLIWDSV